jgi:hypothetical protein
VLPVDLVRHIEAEDASDVPPNVLDEQIVPLIWERLG